MARVGALSALWLATLAVVLARSTEHSGTKATAAAAVATTTNGPGGDSLGLGLLKERRLTFGGEDDETMQTDDGDESINQIETSQRAEAGLGGSSGLGRGEKAVSGREDPVSLGRSGEPGPRDSEGPGPEREEGEDEDDEEENEAVELGGIMSSQSETDGPSIGPSIGNATRLSGKSGQSE